MWAEKHMKLFCLLKKDVKVDDFNEEKIFYKNQQSNRVGTISKEVDELYQNQLLQDKMRAAEEEETMQFIEGVDEETEDMNVDMDIDQSSTEDSVSVNVSLSVRINLSLICRGRSKRNYCSSSRNSTRTYID